MKYPKEEILKEIDLIRSLLYQGEEDSAIRKAKILNREQIRKMGKLLFELSMSGMNNCLNSSDERKYLYAGLFIDTAICANDAVC